MTTKTSTVVWITTQFEGIHCWPDAPDKVEFLRYPHRHIFHVKLAVSVKHDDRDVEFILLKRNVDAYIQLTLTKHPTILRRMSCEMIARKLLEEFEAEWVEVSEDGENGARVEKVVITARDLIPMDLV